MAPRWITFTGIDERTDLGRCLDLSRKHPVEWGILTGGRIGTQRYPGDDVLREAGKAGLRLALHLCGPDAAWINEGALEDTGISPVVLDMVRNGTPDRIQVNRARDSYDMTALPGVLRRFPIRQMILQHRGPVFPAPDATGRMVWLHDESGGRGVATRQWAQPHEDGQFVGYAGGLGPETVAQEVDRMPARNFWIDMESGVRTDDWLDLDKCEAVCRALEPAWA